MKYTALLIISSLSLVAAELTVTIPNDGRGQVLVESMSNDSPVNNPEKRIIQERQIAFMEFKNLKNDEYLASYMSALDPMGYLETIMVTRIKICENDKYSVMLFQPWSGGYELPKDVQEFLSNHRQNYVELEAVYDGHKKRFAVSRGSWTFNSGLRQDCEYSIKIWDHSYQDYKKDRKVIFEKTFRAIKPEFNLYGIDESPEKLQGEQGGAGQPATRPESKSEGSDKPQPEAEGRSR